MSFLNTKRNVDPSGTQVAQPECHLAQITNKDIAAAKTVCVYCQHDAGPTAVFSRAQQLQEGHEICLHASRYRIPYEFKKRKTNRKDMNSSKEEDAEEQLTSSWLDLKVGLPPWASSMMVRNESVVC